MAGYLRLLLMLPRTLVGCLEFTIVSWVAVATLAVSVRAADAQQKVLADALSASVAAAQNHPNSPEDLAQMEALFGSVGALAKGKFATLRPSIAAAAQLDVVAAMMLLADNTQADDPVTAFNWYSAAARKGHVPAVRQLGMMLATHTVAGTPDVDKALHCFQYASDAGDAEAKGALAEHYLLGLGIPKDQNTALALLRESATSGNRKAMNRLGDLLTSIGAAAVNKRESGDAYFAEALQWFTQASDMGDLNALGNLGILHLNGQGVPVDARYAVSLFADGARARNPFCMTLYARCLEHGVGTGKSSLDAQDWYRLAAEAGDKKAVQWCQRNKVSFAEPASNK